MDSEPRVNKDFLVPARTLRVAKCFKESVQILLRGLVHFPDNKDILQEISQCPDNKAILWEISQAYMGEGDVENARKMLEQILDLHPDDYTATFELAKIAEEKSNKKRAKKEPEKEPEFINLPDDLPRETLLELGLSEEKIDQLRMGTEVKLSSNKFKAFAKDWVLKNKLEEALNLLFIACRYFPKNTDILYWIGIVYLKQEDVETAKKYFIKALNINPKNNAITAKLVKILIEEEEWEKAFKYCKKALRLEPQNRTIIYSLVKIKLGRDDPRPAKEFCIGIRPTDPKHESVKEMLRGLIVAGEEAKKKKRLAPDPELSSTDSGKEKTDFPPMNPILKKMSQLIVIDILTPTRKLQNQRRYDEAERLLLEGLKKYPNNRYILNKLGHIYLKQGKLAKAKKCAMEVLFEYPFDEYPLTLLGQIALAENDRVKARKCFLKVLSFKPNDELALCFLGKMAFADGDLNAAKRHFETSLKSHPNNQLMQNLLDEVNGKLN